MEAPIDLQDLVGVDVGLHRKLLQVVGGIPSKIEAIVESDGNAQ